MTASGAFVVGVLVALSVPSHHHQLLASRVRLSLSTDTVSFHERSPVDFYIEVENLTQEHLAINLVLQPVWSRFVRVLYRRIPGEFRELTYTPEWDASGHPDFIPFRLDAGAKKAFPLSIAADPGHGSFVFDQPGTYELKVICDVTRNIYAPKDVLETAPLRINIDPAPPSEAAALEDWDVDLAIFAQNDGSRGTSPRFKRDVRRALRFMESHPTSHYSEALRHKTLDTLEALAREGAEITPDERDAIERLRRAPQR